MPYNGSEQVLRSWGRQNQPLGTFLFADQGHRFEIFTLLARRPFGFPTQRVCHVSDLLLALVLAAVFLLSAFLLTRAFRVPFSPFLVTAATFTLTGLLTQMPSSPLYLFLPDGESYLTRGLLLYETWRAGDPWDEPHWPGKGVWPLVIAILHFVAGPVRLSIIVLNAMLLSLALIFLQKSTLLLFGTKPKLVFVLLTVTSAPVLLNGPTLLRESVFWLGISIGVAAISFFSRNENISGLWLLLVSIAVTLAIRPNLGIVVVYLLLFASIIAWLIQNGSLVRSRILGSLVIAGLASAAFPTLFSQLATDLSTVGETTEVIAVSLQNPKATTAFVPFVPGEGIGENPSFVAQVCDSSAVGSIICRTTANFSHSLLGPFPWEFGPEAIWIVSLASTLHFWALVAASVLLLRNRENRTPATMGLFVLSFVLLLALSTTLTNYGILIRFRAAVEIFLFPLAAGYFSSLPIPKILRNRLPHGDATGKPGRVPGNP